MTLGETLRREKSHQEPGSDHLHDSETRFFTRLRRSKHPRIMFFNVSYFSLMFFAVRIVEEEINYVH